jgi:hypothetical protein
MDSDGVFRVLSVRGPIGLLQYHTPVAATDQATQFRSLETSKSLNPSQEGAYSSPSNNIGREWRDPQWTLIRGTAGSQAKPAWYAEPRVRSQFSLPGTISIAII